MHRIQLIHSTVINSDNNVFMIKFSIKNRVFRINYLIFEMRKKMKNRTNKEY